MFHIDFSTPLEWAQRAKQSHLNHMTNAELSNVMRKLGGAPPPIGNGLEWHIWEEALIKAHHLPRAEMLRILAQISEDGDWRMLPHYILAALEAMREAGEYWDGCETCFEAMNKRAIILETPIRELANVT